MNDVPAAVILAKPDWMYLLYSAAAKASTVDLLKEFCYAGGGDSICEES